MNRYIIIAGVNGTGKSSLRGVLEGQEDLIDQMAKMIIEQNKNIVGKEIAQNAIEKVNQDKAKRKGRPKKQEVEEGGTKRG